MNPQSDHASSGMQITKLLVLCNLVPQLAFSALEDIFRIICGDELPSKTSCVDFPEGQHKMESPALKLRNSFSEIRTSFSKVVSSLDVFESHFKTPSEETAALLKDVFRRKNGEMNRLSELKNIILNLTSFKPHSDKECKISPNSGVGRFYLDAFTDENYDKSHMCSNHTPLSDSKESKKKDFKDSELDDQPLQNSTDKKQQQNEQSGNQNKLMISQEPKCREHQSRESLITRTKKPPRLKKNIDRTVSAKKSKKLEIKVPGDDFGIRDEEIGTLKSCDYATLRALENEVYSLRVENRELMAQLGEIMFEISAIEEKARKGELFQQIYRPSSPETKESVVCTSEINKNDKENTLHESSYLDENAYNTNYNADSASLVSKAASSEDAVQGAESLVKENGHHPGKEGVVKNNKNERNCHDRDENRAGMLAIASRKTSGGEGMDRSGSVSGTSSAALRSREENVDQTSTEQSYESLSFSVQQDYSNEKEKISLRNVPPTSVATTMYNNYKLLLLSLGQMLLSSDVAKLISWATQNFPVVNPQNATHVLFQLDENGVINATDLNQLRHFFESIVRFDLVHIIDSFLLGDYAILRQIPASKKRDARTTQNPQHGTATRNSNIFNAASASQFPLRGSSARAENINEPPSSIIQLKQQAFPSLFSKHHTSNGAKFLARSPNENQSSTYQQQHVKSGATGSTESNLVVGNGPGTNERRTTGNSSTNSSATIGSNGSRLSKFQQNREQSDNWLCSHYKRHCYVKFECCDQFWPCHRCHNNQSTCGRKKLKSRDTQMVKCAYCNKEQQFGEKCCDCGAKFASYYCGKCKHLTGTDDHPYHCEKCGICRIHGDRSFHCDICGVCLDVQLRGNHKCREGSAHDECCICLEDAFTGCQILPCSHKVHKECATQMIRSGITRCPICRESFAHKLERRALPNARKRPGK